MHTAYARRRRCRGTYYKDYVASYVFGVVSRVGCSFSAVVNRLLEKAINEGLSDIEDKLRLEVRRSQLLDEEAGLRQTLTVLLRSGAYLPQYAEKLFVGQDSRDLLTRKGRLPLPAVASAKEQDVVRRILARREKLVEELVEVEDKLLPQDKFSAGLEETGWTTRSNQPPREPKQTGQSRQQTGGEKR